MQIKIKRMAHLVAISAAGALSAYAQPVGQWDFDAGTLAGTVGTAMDYVDGAGGATQTGTQFGTTTSFGIPDIGGAAANVIKVPKAIDATMGFTMPVASDPVGGGLVNSYTIIWDILFPTESSGKWRALLEADNRLINEDAEFFVNDGNGIGISGAYSGTVQANTWHRIGLVADGDTKTLRKFIDGNLVGQQTFTLIDDRFALTPQGIALLFADNDGESEVAYVNSIQLRNVALSNGEMRALGAALAAGIQQTIPPVPSGIERFIPATAFSSRNTEVGAVIATGSTTIQDASISLSLNGTPIASPTITRDGDLITVRSAAQNLTAGNKYTNVVSYTDSIAGAQSFTNVFTAAVFFEDFNSIPLGPNIEEGSVGEEVWTNTPPTGWLIDNTNMPGLDSPDDDGDGRPDNDGRSEWAGWAFADKDWWPTVDDQRRSEFTLASGAAAIADPDEWDDGYSDPTIYGGEPKLFNSLLTTPNIPLAGIAANTALLRFDSSWRPEAEDDGAPKFPLNDAGNPTNNQTALITVSYDGGAPVTVMKWDSKSGSPTFHTDSPNESVSVQLNNPAGAQNMKITFAMLYSANDWWWAIDNIVVNAGAAPPAIGRQPAGGLFSTGANATLSVDVTGSEPLTFQWKKDGTDVSGATTRTLTLNNLQAANAGVYTVVVNNAAGSVTSDGASVQLYSGAITNDLVVHLKMDGNVTDSSGKGNNGEAVGVPIFEAGKVGNAVHLATDVDYVTLGAPADLNFGTDTDFSIAFWAKVNAFGGDPSLIGNKDWDSGGNQGYVIFTESNRRVDWNLAGAPGARKDGDAVPSAFPSNEWAHVVLTFDRNGLAVTYTNGVRVLGSSLAANANNLDTPDGFATNIGQDGAGDYGSRFTDLSVDDLGIWRRVLTVQEAAAIYNAGVAGQDLSTAVVGGGPGGPITITSAQRSGANLVINVTGTGTLQLQRKTTLSDAWSNVAGAPVNGVFTVPIEGATGFFRVAGQ